MEVKEFVNKYNAIKNAQLRDKFVKENIIIKDYVGIINKKVICDKIVSASCSCTDGVFLCDTFMQYLLFIRSIIKLYTNLDIPDDDAYSWYDDLCSSGILKTVLDMIPSNEYKEMQAILDMVSSDRMSGEMSVKNFLSSSIYKIIDLISPLIENNLSEYITNVSSKKLDNHNGE